MTQMYQHNAALLICMVLIVNTVFSQTYNTEVEAKINLETYGDIVRITGSAANKTGSTYSLSYVLSVIKGGPNDSNKSKNDQSGRFVLEPGEKKNLSSTTINADDKDRIIILLLIYDLENNPLGMDRIVINASEDDIEKKEIEKEEEKKDFNISPDARENKDDGAMLKGIVTEDTKTKPGRDFYKMFYSLYATNNVNGEEPVNIKEVLSLNNNTKIEIYVASDKIMEFIVRPQTQYLTKLSEVAIRRVYHYLQQYKQNKNVQKYY